MAVDYDPVKAHEYYEQHKKLKGRRSTKGFSQTQKKQWSYAKDQLSNQRKERNANSRARISAQRKSSLSTIDDAKRVQKEQLTNTAKQKIDALKDKLKAMSPEQKKEFKAKVADTIATIRQKLSSDKADINEKSNTQKKKSKRTCVK